MPRGAFSIRAEQLTLIDGASNLPRELAISGIGGVPFLGLSRFVAFRIETAAHDGASVVERFDFADGHRLDEDISDGSAFDRAGDDGSAARVGGHLIQQQVLRPAADDVDRGDLSAKDVF